MRMATATASKTRTLGAQRAEVSRLTTYEWVALDKRGKRMKGDMPAKNASLVKAELRRQGMNPQTVRERAKPLFGSSGKPVKPLDVAVFSRQIATMMACRWCSRSTSSPTARRTSASRTSCWT
jgi:type IV pilus assembly protein PilC